MINLLFTGIEAMFLRFHNQIAKTLNKLNPSWTSDQIYQETRKLTVGYFQILTYYEWLPVLLGEKEYAHLCTLISGPYDPNVNNEIKKENSLRNY
jgi:peroxidase